MATAAVSAPIIEGPRFYEPVPISSSADSYGHSRSDRYGVRARNGGHHHRVMARELGLTWDRADRLCDLLEEVRQLALEESVEA
jgi:hypothetical protein